MTKKNVLIVTMSLGIGGAETHIIELSKKLVENGHRVWVISNGGVFVPLIKEKGIRHIKAPLHRKNIVCLLKSYKIIRKTIIFENIDIVHAHARIPAFVCNRVCEKLKVPFVTTVHAEFKTSPILKMFTRWGSHSLTVSEDIREYLLNNYNFDKEKTMLTVNGINEEIFKPGPPNKELLREFNIKPENFVITTICRLDKSSSKTAALLLENVDQLYEKIEGLRIIITGDGDIYEKCANKAKAINKKYKKEIITMTGARKDVEAVLSISDIFTGISRAAMEAMSMKKPVVLCGNFGYMGILDEKKVKEAIRTNMTCRGSRQATGEELVKDLTLLYNSPNLRREKGLFNYKIIREHYSVDKMAKDAELLYAKAFAEAKVPPKYYHAVISGYYGFDNSGDEAMLSSIIHELKNVKKDIRLLVLSKKPQKTSNKHNVDSTSRSNPITLKKAISKTGLLISGGGNLVQDLTSFQSMLYYTGLIKYAKNKGRKVMLYANGIGPLIRETSEKIAASILNEVDVITVREKNSYEILNKIGVNKPEIHITADAVMSVAKPEADIVKKAIAEHGLQGSFEKVIFSVRPWKGLEDDFISVFADVADYVYEKYKLTPVLMPMNTKKDTKVLEEIAQKMKHKSIVIQNEDTIENLIALISDSKMVIGMRLHSLIYAAIGGTPAIGIVYDPKVRFFIEMMEQLDGGNIETMNKQKLTGLIDHLMENLELYEEKSVDKIKELRKLSIENAQITKELMERDSILSNE